MGTANEKLQNILRLLCELKEAPMSETAARNREIDNAVLEMLGPNSATSVTEAREYIYHQCFPDYWRTYRDRNRQDVRK